MRRRAGAGCRSRWWAGLAAIGLGAGAGWVKGEESRIRVGGQGWTRELEFDGQVWRTVAWKSGERTLRAKSEEFHLLMMDDREITLGDFVAEGRPERVKSEVGEVLTLSYRPKKAWESGKAGPEKVEISYEARAGEAWGRKRVRLEFKEAAVVDRLEVERFRIEAETERGGRGEPVWMDGKWFAGLEYPAGYSRHGDGNQPEADAHRYELVGNYSFIDLEGRDRIKDPKKGMVRLFHFPGDAERRGEKWAIESQPAVIGGGGSRGAEEAFRVYLGTIQKADRSFTHYNNWFDPAGKDVSPEKFLAVYRRFRGVLDEYGVRLDAMVPDDGWQNRQSVWEPSARYYPGGMEDLQRLAEELRKEGTNLGLWLALNGTNLDHRWGEAQGFHRAKPNAYLRQYFPAYSLAHPLYAGKVREQLARLAGGVKVNYFKHDFNHLSDLSDGCGHPPTDRHGHEANVNAMLDLLAATREANPEIYQNLTNWVWFSPWWLMHGDALWMLAGDDGANGNWPELSVRTMATTDRDVYLWRMWGDAKDRPLVPVSRLMTHGIVLNPGRQLEGPGDGVREWADHVMMYYGRGVQMKEWYLSPQSASAEHWKALLTVHRWAEKNFGATRRMEWFGGRPDEGEVYGYAGCDGRKAVAVVRNPAVRGQTWKFELPEAFRKRLEASGGGRGTVVYPYRGAAASRPGKDGTMEVEVPGYHTLAIEWEPGTEPAEEAAPDAVTVTAAGRDRRFRVPADVAGRADLLVMGYPAMPVVWVNGKEVKPRLESKARINAFASYARRGMVSEKARPWVMAAVDLQPWKGKEVVVRFEAGDELPDGEATYEAWLLLDRKGRDLHLAGEEDLPWAVDAGMRRQTVEVVKEQALPGVKVESRRLTGEDRRRAVRTVLKVDVFGVNGPEYGKKQLVVNGKEAGELPQAGDQWSRRWVELDPELARELKEENEIEVRLEKLEDKFKVRNWQLRVKRDDGVWVVSREAAEVRTAGMDWAHAEGEGFEEGGKRLRVRVGFR